MHCTALCQSVTNLLQYSVLVCNKVVFYLFFNVLNLFHSFIKPKQSLSSKIEIKSKSYHEIKSAEQRKKIIFGLTLVKKTTSAYKLKLK